MTENKRKKNSRQRASHTHGWGAKKKHRGAGNRGGRGRAGSGKRGDAKKPSFWKEKDAYGRAKGFKSIKKHQKTINISELHKFNSTEINLKSQGYTKLLAMGTVVEKFNISVEYASQKAIEKIKKAGGEVKLLVEKKIKKTATQAKPKKKIEEDSEAEEEPKTKEQAPEN
ncbi:MAG: uL15m family ribosomal protein [Nanoarchaeota archaeon]|nr:uL15 family ribosomal protein [Nanoarchaeota archaeon]MBU1030529.1 uL15 family ribosomal protein [Nanoarchaeota archaeon]MBU1849493.1 uL15 family ribosomal protein [Nanoarchaeota archaeon]